MTISRAELKFSSPISVLNYIPLSNSEDSLQLLISSTLGPAAIWLLSYIDGKLEWHRETVLDQSHHWDCIVCGTIGRDIVCIGTYKQVCFIYQH